jgi:peptidoglycan/LPS O-acetylase OafA/YrhL
MVITLACRIRGLHLHDSRTLLFIVVAELVGALIAAELGHRFIERLLIPRKAPAPAIPTAQPRPAAT